MRKIASDSHIGANNESNYAYVFVYASPELHLASPTKLGREEAFLSIGFLANRALSLKLKKSQLAGRQQLHSAIIIFHDRVYKSWELRSRINVH